MSERAAVVPPNSGLIAAMGPRNRGSLPPVCLLPETPPGEAASSPLLWPWRRLIHQGSPPPHALEDRRFSAQHLVNLLVNRPRLY